MCQIGLFKSTKCATTTKRTTTCKGVLIPVPFTFCVFCVPYVFALWKSMGAFLYLIHFCPIYHVNQNKDWYDSWSHCFLLWTQWACLEGNTWILHHGGIQGVGRRVGVKTHLPVDDLSLICSWHPLRVWGKTTMTFQSFQGLSMVKGEAMTQAGWRKGFWQQS